MKTRVHLLFGLAVLAFSFTCLAHEPVTRARTPVNIPDIPGYVTLKCDFHIHTVFSDGLVWPTVRTEEAWRQGLDAIAITDHNEIRAVSYARQLIPRLKEQGLLPQHFLLIPLERTALAEPLPVNKEEREWAFAEDEMLTAFTLLGGPPAAKAAPGV